MRGWAILLKLVAAGFCAAFFTSCEGGDDDHSGLPKVVTSTTMITDLAKVIGGENVEVVGLMGAGIDPHMYTVSQSALIDIKKADLIIYNGLHLEGKAESIFEDQKERGATVITVAKVISSDKLIDPGEGEEHSDPHLWGDVSLWSECIKPVEDALTELDPDNAEAYRNRAEAFRAELKELHDWAKNRIADVPEDQRVLVTSHDAFNYFGRAYGLEVIGLQGISTVGELGIAARVALTEQIKERGIKAIFVESSVNSDAIRGVAGDAGVEIGGELFSDALGTPGEIEEVDGVSYDVGTYTGMIRHNVNTIVEALR